VKIEIKSEIENLDADQKFCIWRAYRVEKNERGEEEFIYIEGTASFSEADCENNLKGVTHHE
tara:strand:+ start:1179 stop:1364 length:186 start_codon:yes stop_codon:yes gene_type:complete